MREAMLLVPTVVEQSSQGKDPLIFIRGYCAIASSF